MSIDMGTGDGRAVLAAAAREPATLVLGVDANAAAMVEASRRAARSLRRGGLANAHFVLASAEVLPAELAGRADLVTVRFPWGSLLRGCVGRDPAVAVGLAGLVAPGGVLEMLVAPAERDRLDGVPTTVPGLIAAVARAFGDQGLELAVGREATSLEVAATGSTWARRLGVARLDPGSNGNGTATRRSVTLVRLVRR